MSLWKLFLITVVGLSCCTTLRAGIHPYKYKTVQVSLVDDETGEPVPKAKVDVSYSDDYYFYHPKPDSAVTNGKGIASVKIAVGTSDWHISLTGKGYFPSWISDFGQNEISDRTEFTSDLKKIPKATLVVPKGYVGPIMIDLPKIPPAGLKKVSHREYLFHADASGKVNVESIESRESLSDLEYALGRDYLTAIYDDGCQIPAESSGSLKDTMNALRYVVKITQISKKQNKPQNSL